MPYSMPLCTILTKWPAPLGPQCKIALLGGAVDLFAPGRARNVAHARRQRLEDRIETLDRLVRAADHHAVAALQTPHAAAGAHIHVVDSLRREFLGAADIVDIVGVAAVDEDVSRLEIGHEVSDGFVHDCRRDHQPDCPRLVELLHEVLQRGRALRPFP